MTGGYLKRVLDDRLVLNKSELGADGWAKTQPFNCTTLLINFVRLRWKRVRRLWDSNRQIDSSINDFSWHCAVTENFSDS